MNSPSVPLTAEQQRQLLDRLTRILVSAVEPGWRQLRVDYRAMGRHVETDLVITDQNGTPALAAPPAQVVQLLGALRAGMYERGRGTWFGVVVVVLPSGPPRVEYRVDEEQLWRRQPPPQGYQDELRFFPRPESDIPGWLRRGAGMEDGPESEAGALTRPAVSHGDGQLRLPKVYDGLGGDGRPVVNRPPLDLDEKERVLDYLGAAPVVLAARGYDTDAFDPEREPSVPLTFRTDGTWVWPGAVAYYLREHDVAPDPDLLAHIRDRNYTPPEVGEEARRRAIETVTGQPADSA